MIRAGGLDLPANHRRWVSTILNANLPPRATVWVFGSRATGGARLYSDLDLAIDAGRPLTLDEIANLSEAFRNSDLPYRVDLVDWYTLDARFRQIITPDLRPFSETG